MTVGGFIQYIGGTNAKSDVSIREKGKYHSILVKCNYLIYSEMR